MCVSFPDDLAIKPTENTQDEAGDIDTYGLAGITWHAALLLQDYATTSLSNYDPPFKSLLLPKGNIILDIGVCVFTTSFLYSFTSAQVQFYQLRQRHVSCAHSSGSTSLKGRSRHLKRPA